jgi:hypothetical protein
MNAMNAMNDDVPDVVATVARSAARKLAGPLARPGLEMDVVAALYSRDSDRAADRYADPVEIGGLIVSIASLAWQIYSDRRKKGEKTDHKVLIQVLINRQEDEHLNSTRESTRESTQEKIIQVVAGEVIDRADGDPDA